MAPNEELEPIIQLTAPSPKHESLEPPTTHTELLRHIGKTLQQMIDEGVGSSHKNPIDIDQLDDSPGLSCHNPIVVDHPHTDNTNPYAFRVLPH